MAERHKTGGSKEFHYKNEDLDKIRSTNTESTKAFKEAYHAWRSQRFQGESMAGAVRKHRTRLLLAVAALLVVMLLYIVIKSG